MYEMDYHNQMQKQKNKRRQHARHTLGKRLLVLFRTDPHHGSQKGACFGPYQMTVIIHHGANACKGNICQWLHHCDSMLILFGFQNLHLARRYTMFWVRIAQDPGQEEEEPPSFGFTPRMSTPKHGTCTYSTHPQIS